MVTINGKSCQFDGISVLSMLEKDGYTLARILTELNGQIVPKDSYAETILKDGDVVEVVSFVGGG